MQGTTVFIISYKVINNFSIVFYIPLVNPLGFSLFKGKKFSMPSHDIGVGTNGVPRRT